MSDYKNKIGRVTRVSPEKPPTALNSFHAEKSLLKRVGVMLDGVSQAKDIYAYDSIQGWVRYLDGTIKRGKVEPFWRA